MNKRHLPNIQAVADHFKVTHQAVTRWRQQGMPDKDARGWSIAKTKKWLAERSKKSGRVAGAARGTTDNGLRDELLRAQVLRAKAKAQREEIQLKEELGSLIPLTEVKERDVRRIQVVKRELLAVPRMVAHELVGLNAKEIEVVLKKRVRELLERFSRM